MHKVQKYSQALEQRLVEQGKSLSHPADITSPVRNSNITFSFIIISHFKHIGNFVSQESLKLLPFFPFPLIQMAIEECPTLYPTWKQFKNFADYVEKVDQQYKSKYGMVKVVPPPEWKAKSSDYSHRLENLMINGPIEQNIFGKSGVYECLHIQKKSMSYKEYRTKMGVFDKITEGLSASEVEAMFWKNIVFSPPLYGADLLTTLMDQSAGSWNLNHLDSLLKYAVNVNVKGVTTSYCYIGSWKTLFCWHREDLDLSAINYLHEGKSKFWYSIPSNQSHILQKEAKALFAEHFSKCPEHLRHKTTLINPYNLKKKYPELRISKIQHKPKEFMLVLGGSYHCGFNFGVNIAEAINYATLDWLNQLPNTHVCRCSKSTVRASNTEILKNLENSTYSKSKEFAKFKEYVYTEVEKQEQEADKQEQQKRLKSQYSRKIRKDKKAPKRLKINGEEYKVQSWAQCDKCNQWRRVPQILSGSFNCASVQKPCNLRQRLDTNYITL